MTMRATMSWLTGGHRETENAGGVAAGSLKFEAY
jgi:hypothetical protein